MSGGLPTISPATRRRIADRVERATGDLRSAALARMDQEMEWFRALEAQERAWIGLVVQAGITSFTHWLTATGDRPLSSFEVFGAAPPALTGVVSLHQTVELVRLTITVVEEHVESVAGEGDGSALQELVLRYGREVAFATAEVYARAAEMRGAWDARLEALLVDAVMRADDLDAIRSRASALGWSANQVCAVVGELHQGPQNGATTAEAIEAVRTGAEHLGLSAVCAVQGQRLIVVLGNVQDAHRAGDLLASHFGGDHVVVGPLVPDIVHSPASVRAAMSGLRAAPGWHGAPRVVLADDLLPERVLIGERYAAEQLIDEVYLPLTKTGEQVLETVVTYLEHGRALEATARALFVHGNTVRYRLHSAADATGLDPTDPRHGFTIRMAVALGRLAEQAPPNL
jgi:hypothetical protein